LQLKPFKRLAKVFWNGIDRVQELIIVA